MFVAVLLKLVNTFLFCFLGQETKESMRGVVMLFYFIFFFCKAAEDWLTGT